MIKLTPEQIESILSRLSPSPVDAAKKAQLRKNISSYIPPVHNPFTMSLYYKIAGVTAAVMLVTAGTGLYVLGNPEITRASTLYPVKQAAEAVGGVFAVTSAQEAAHHMELAHERVQEAAFLASDPGATENDENVTKTLADLSDETTAAMDAANGIDDTEDALQTITLLNQLLAQNIAVLQGFSGNTVGGDVNILIQQMNTLVVNMQTLIVQIQELNASGVVNVTINVNDGTADENDDDGSGSGSQSGSGSEPVKVTVCHKGKNELSISENAVPAHLNHGDSLGECPSDDADENVSPAQSDKHEKSEGNDKTPPGQLKKQENNALNATNGNSEEEDDNDDKDDKDENDDKNEKKEKKDKK